MTLRQFVALQDRFLEDERRKDRRTAHIVATVMNMAGKVVKQTITVEELMGDGVVEKRQTPDQMRQVLAGLSWIKPVD